MARALVGLLVVGGCLVPNPEWAGSDAGGQTQSTSSSGTTGSSGEGTEESGAVETGGQKPAPVLCPPPDALPAGAVIVDPAMSWGDIGGAVANATAGTTIAFEPGTYVVGDQGLVLDVPQLTLTSTTRDRSDVIIQGSGTDGALIRIEATGVTISDLTLDSATVGLRLGTETEATGAVITRVHFRDLLNGISALEGADSGIFTDNVEVACSLFTISHDPRAGETCEGFRAINCSGGRDWHVHDNVIQGYFCEDVASSTASVRFGAGARGTLVERNRFSNVYRGLVLGGQAEDPNAAEARSYADNPCEDIYWGHIEGIVRNNLFWNGAAPYLDKPYADDIAVALWVTCETAVHHNTIITLTEAAMVAAAIEVRYPGGTALAANNLVSSHIIAAEDAMWTRNEGNLEEAPATEVVDATLGDLHLAAGAMALDAGVLVELVTDDIDGQPRNNPPDIGAYEVD